LNLSHNLISALSFNAQQLTALWYLDLVSNDLAAFPFDLTNLPSVKYLDLSENHLISLPNSIGDLQAVDLLNLEKNNLAVIPYGIGRMRSLQVLKLNYNHLAFLPDSIVDCGAIRRIETDNNQWNDYWRSLTNSSLEAIRRQIAKWRETLPIILDKIYFNVRLSDEELQNPYLLRWQILLEESALNSSTQTAQLILETLRQRRTISLPNGIYQIML
jgi:Leucine-rich repeat (LRR) protein